MAKSFVNHRQMYVNTVSGILDAIRAGRMSKREVQAHTSFSWGNVSQNMAKLLELGVIVPLEVAGSQEKTVGRRAQQFTFTGGDYLLLGMEIKSDVILSSLVTLSGEVIGAYTLNRKISQANLLKSIAACYEKTVKRATVGRERIYAVSFSLSGAVNSDTLTWIASSKVPSIDHFDFSQCKTIFPSQTIRIERSSVALTRTVLKTNSIPSDNFVFLSIGNGIGMSVQENGRFLTGSNGLACEIGHIPYAGNGATKATSGYETKDCLEHFLSTGGLLNEIRKFPGLEQCEDLAQGVTQLTSGQKKALYHFLLPLVIHLTVILCNIFDPECLIIGGKALNPWLDDLKRDLVGEIRKKTCYLSPKALVFFCHSDSFSTAYGTTQGLEAAVYTSIIEKLNGQA